MSDPMERLLAAYDLLTAANELREISQGLTELSRGDYQTIEAIATQLVLLSRRVQVIEQRVAASLFEPFGSARGVRLPWQPG